MTNRIATSGLVLLATLAGCESSAPAPQDCSDYCEGAEAYINSSNWNQAPRAVVACDDLCSDPLASDFERCCDLYSYPPVWRSCVERASDSLWRDDPDLHVREWVVTAARYEPVSRVLRIESARVLSAGVTGCATEPVLALVHEFPENTGFIEIEPLSVEPGSEEVFESAKWDALAEVVIDASGLGALSPRVFTELEFDETAPWVTTVYLQDLEGLWRYWYLALPWCPTP